MSEKFSLKWNDYQSNWSKALSELHNDNDFADVTLISDDKVNFSAHKILLSSCSSMFKFILKSNTNGNPLLFLGGLSSINLGYILDFIYHGEVNIYQEHLDSFLDSAQKLEIEGLLGGNQDCHENSNHFYLNGHPVEEKIDLVHGEQKYHQPEEKGLVEKIMNSPIYSKRQYSRTNSNIVERIDVSSMTPEETEEKKKELYQKTDGTWNCLACDYSNRDRYNIKRHIETHIDGLSYTCTLCNKEFRLKDSLNCHISRSHRK